MIPEPAVSELSNHLGDRFTLSAGILAQHGQSETHVTGGLPDAVAYPMTTQEVERIAKVCTAHRIPMIG